ncbi:MAG TPA: hypothetical protein VFK02_03735 [Kofleriaceae bacterium]|nr:hypothetical protein [Kofleriaceae bacterium]
MERSIGLAFTTLTIFAPLAHASHPQQAVRPEGTASPLEFVATGPDHRGLAFARQVLPPRLARASSATATARAADAPQRALSRVIYLNRDGVILRPGDNDSARQRSTIVAEPTVIDGWDIDDDTWDATVACVAEIYAPFDVAITDVDPGDVPHIEAVFGGSPGDVGLPDNVAGVSPFTTDCAIIESSIVFTFTDLLPDDPRTICEVAAQEIAHSFGLDHEMLPSDPMTYLDYDGERTFQDEMAACGEYADRTCGVNGLMCRQRQNSFALLEQRLGARKAGAGRATDHDGTPGSGTTGGCTATGGSAGLAMALAWLGVRRRRRR